MSAGDRILQAPGSVRLPPEGGTPTVSALYFGKKEMALRAGRMPLPVPVKNNRKFLPNSNAKPIATYILFS